MADHDEIEDPLHAIAGTGRPPVIAPGHTFGTVTDKISSIVLTRKTSLGWYAGFGFAFALTLLRTAARAIVVARVWGEDGLAENRTFLLCDPITTPIAAVLNAAFAWCALFKRRAEWAGTVYEINGPFSDWYATARSDPPMDPADVNALLWFGMTIDDLEALSAAGLDLVSFTVEADGAD